MTSLQQAEHFAEFGAPAERGYQLISDVALWPVLFGPCVAAEVLEKSATTELVRLWAVVGPTVRSWTSRRGFDEQALRVDFGQEEPSPPVTAMSGHWEFTRPAGGVDPARLVLRHEWTTDGTPEQAAEIAQALDRNSTAEIAAVRRWAEQPVAPAELVFSFTDSMFIPSAPAPVYDFLYRADLWPQRLAHVSRVDLETAAEPVAGGWVQTMDMRTIAGDGSTHGTRSVRLCFPDERIVYKQTIVPRGLLGHCGEWIIRPARGGVTVLARHTFALDPATPADIFGLGTTLDDAKQLVRKNLSGNSRQTLAGARDFADGTAGGPGAVG